MNELEKLGFEKGDEDEEFDYYYDLSSECGINYLTVYCYDDSWSLFLENVEEEEKYIIISLNSDISAIEEKLNLLKQVYEVQ